MTQKNLLTGLITGAAAVAFTVGGAAGITNLAAAPVVPAITPVVWDIPMPAAPAPELSGALTQTLNGLAAGGSFASKQNYIEGGLGRIATRAADAKYQQKAAEGVFPLSFNVMDIDQNGPVATANVTANSATGNEASMPLTFVQGPSPSGWQLSKGSVGALLAAMN